ncbi:hypothetical protein JCM21714_1995 [Gracilibacillus boraciitolerans JCM 21714]|uniref:DUF4178 domain-containing protein n=1 Tax=Gracilibacillus boraciitolerans JCM 21714 TaxID=1298598 RepID=W4VIJ7_9BACI|nr:DUF4178 domain-containing protein [Gracilibacillus boraciitolerans]GAE92966.1 hypothetical protein JCM21714_1995 [Gracilibacillus boraciitolerans JCM 21714]
MGFFSNLFNKKEQKATVKKRDLLSIEVGDIIEYDLADYEVVGKIAYQEGNYKWYSYQLLGESKNIWLAAEMDDKLELGIYETISIPLADDFPKEIVFNNTTYFLDESGHAQIKGGEGRSSSLTGQQIHYAEYCDKEEQSFISIEEWNSDVEVSIGYPIESFEIKIIAGS